MRKTRWRTEVQVLRSSWWHGRWGRESGGGAAGVRGRGRGCGSVRDWDPPVQSRCHCTIGPGSSAMTPVGKGSHS